MFTYSVYVCYFVNDMWCESVCVKVCVQVRDFECVRVRMVYLCVCVCVCG